jgi:DOPA 4,5-dioxygenase
MPDPVAIRGYHAHVYYGADTRERAEALRADLAQGLAVELGELRGVPTGPHPVPQFRMKFAAAEFERVVPWLMLNRRGLDILVHPLSDDSLADHTRYAIWLGNPVKLKLDTLRGSYRDEQLPAA